MATGCPICWSRPYRNLALPNATAAPAPVVENGYLMLTLTKRAGVHYTIESAGTLAGADFSTATTTVLLDNAIALKVRDNVPVGSGPSRFLRTRVTAAPSRRPPAIADPVKR